MSRLWDRFDGEPFLDNPHLFVLNPRKRKASKMRRTRNRKGQFIKGNPVRRTRTARRRRAKVIVVNPRRRTRRVAARRRKVYITNPRRRRRALGDRVHRRRMRHNPPGDMLGFSGGNLKTAGYVVLGVVGTPFVSSFVQTIVPTSLLGNNATVNQIVGYGVKIGSAWGLGWAAGKLLGREAGRLVFVGGLAYTALTIINNVMPSLSGGVSAQPLLGRYTKGLGAYRQLSSQVTARTPSRLDPAGRY